MQYVAWRYEVENTKSGFQSAGIYPVDSQKYPVSRFDPIIFKKYELKLNDVKPPLDD